MQLEPRFCNGAAMRKATRRLGQLYDDFLRPSGLRTTQYTILAHVHGGWGQTMHGLAQRLVMDQSALGHTLKPLIRDGYIGLATDARDRRAKTVVLTPAGEAKLAEATRLWRKAQMAFEQAYGAENAKRLRDSLDYLVSDGFQDAFRTATSL